MGSGEWPRTEPLLMKIAKERNLEKPRIHPYSNQSRRGAPREAAPKTGSVTAEGLDPGRGLFQGHVETRLRMGRQVITCLSHTTQTSPLVAR